jgi:hypothetical protein
MKINSIKGENMYKLIAYVFVLCFVSLSTAQEKKSWFSKIDSIRQAEKAAEKDFLKQTFSKSDNKSTIKCVPIIVGITAGVLTIIDANRSETIHHIINGETQNVSFQHKWNWNHTILLTLSIGLTFSGTF